MYVLEKNVQMRSSVERRKFQRCVTCYITVQPKSIMSLLKETCWTSQLACNVCLRKIVLKNTSLALELDPVKHAKERW